MKLSQIGWKDLLRQNLQGFECLLIFSSCLFIYFANNRTISSNDSIPNTLLAFQWLQNQTLHFDAFRGGHYYMPNDIFGPNGIPYFFVEAPNGHLTSSYPIGTAIVSFPIFLGIFLYLKLAALWQSGWTDSSTFLNLTDPSFELQREFYEKLAGTLLTALATTVFYLLVRQRFSRAVAWITTFIYAFATLNWVVSSQGLWPHTVSNLLLVSTMLCLVKANHVRAGWQAILLVTAGFFCGLLPGVRPTSSLFAATVLIYVIFTYRKAALFFLMGTSSFLISTIWNVAYFGLSLRSIVVGGYANLLGQGLGQSSGNYNFTFAYFRQAFPGLLVSPSRGILIYSPILLFAIPGIRAVFRRPADPDQRLLAFLTIASLILFIQYCFFTPWWGAITYGSRFLTDILPVLCYLIAYFLAQQFTASPPHRQRLWTATTLLFSLCLVFSTFVQVVGAFSDTHGWDTSPINHHTRFWDWQDSQITRQAKNLGMKLRNPIPDRRIYARRLNGKILAIKDQQGQPLTRLTANPSQELILQADLRNTGRSPWYGYDTGLVAGQTVVKVRFIDAQGKEVEIAGLNFLHTIGTPEKGEKTTAIGQIRFPQAPGDYTAVFSFGLQRLGDFPKRTPTYELKVRVEQPVSLLRLRGGMEKG